MNNDGMMVHFMKIRYFENSYHQETLIDWCKKLFFSRSNHKVHHLLFKDFKTVTLPCIAAFSYKGLKIVVTLLTWTNNTNLLLSEKFSGSPFSNCVTVFAPGVGSSKKKRKDYSEISSDHLFCYLYFKSKPVYAHKLIFLRQQRIFAFLVFTSKLRRPQN